MPTFKFALAPALDHRQRLEDEAFRRRAAIQMRLDQCHLAIRKLEEDRRTATREMFEGLQTGMLERERVLYVNFLRGLDSERKSLDRQERQIRIELEEASRRLIKASQDRKIIEEVKKVEYKRFLAAEAAEERKQLDELGQRGWRILQAEKIAADPDVIF